LAKDPAEKYRVIADVCANVQRGRLGIDAKLMEQESF
jgi:hypothetical protein